MLCLCLTVFFGSHYLTVCVQCQVCHADMGFFSDNNLSWSYCNCTRMHSVGGKTFTFTVLLGKDCKETLFPCGKGFLQVVPGGTHAKEITLKWTPKRPGTLWVIFGGFMGFGPVVDADGTRGALWVTKRSRV
jgi:hypothetical protein